MSSIEQSNLRFRTIWISDIHLGTRGCKAEFLLDFLRHTESDYLYLVGDIIDIWRLKRSWYWTEAHNEVVQAVLRKARRGTRVYFIPGNHDEKFRDFGPHRFGRVAVVDETVHVTASRLHDNRSRPSTRHAHWQRFLAIRADAQQAAAMEPLVPAGAIAVLDRHYNSLAPYRAHQSTLYAVRNGAALSLRFVDFDEGHLILRPYSRDFPVQLLPLATHESPADYIVGRVCLVFSEL